MKWLIIALVILAALPVLWLRGGLFQEPLSTIIAAAKMEWKGAASAAVDGGTLARASSEPAHLAEWEADGWRLKEQLGSGYVLTREAETITYVCRNWSTRYRICGHDG